MTPFENSMAEIASISIHFSSDCNMACTYCYIEKDKKCMAAYNREIRKSLEDGSFAKIIKEKAASIKDQIENLSLWGAEPTINSKFFKEFIYELLDFFPNVNGLMFSTNALLGADLIYNDFLIPLKEYSECNKRKFKFELQLSLDGPPEFNDASRHAGATENTLNVMRSIIQRMPDSSEYFTLDIFTKATLDISYMRLMLEGGVEKFQWYYDFMNRVAAEADELAKNKTCVLTQGMGSCPTLVDPGYHTVQDGKDLAAWIHTLQFVDRSKFDALNKRGPLFWQILTGMGHFLESKNPHVDSINLFSCSSSKCNITIDHEGNLYTCNRLCRNSALSDDFKTKHAMRSNTTVGAISDKEWMKRTYGSFAFHDNILSRFEIARTQMYTLARCGQIESRYATDYDEQLSLYLCLLGLMCHIGAEEDYTQNPFLMPFSYYRYLGNGAVHEMLEYYKLEVMRGNVQAWKIVM